MGAGAFVEPLVVVTLLFGGTWVNRNPDYRLFNRRRVYSASPRSTSPSSGTSSGRSSPSSSASLLSQVDDEPKWRKRNMQMMGLQKEVVSPNTKQFQNYFLSRLLRKFPFLVEAWYWALIYWVRLAIVSPNSSLRTNLRATGIPTRPCIQRRNNGRRHRNRRTPSRPPTHTPRATPAPLPRALCPSMVPTPPLPHALDKPHILLHPHPRHNPLSRVALLLHHHAQPHRSTRTQQRNGS